ncbi:hypothetical protein G6O67_003143 [Ophiocordyceps sinensis]|uniref:Uncharacterized protein n=2 Tax=Ophiocordyceps sinensis TaxID=72228 RepID=A0A8H4PVV2_9HYPO|nr:hypothetical protein OCS_03288 [Ophiocordyceps sinensis CO18]KAF4511335.1 hypothetical protein G6O67_003143 [Ophiocordyceps sinensis]
MASLARSFLFPCGRQSLLRPRLQAAVESRTTSAARLFTTSLRFRAAAQVAPKTAKPLPRVSKVKAPSPAPPPPAAAAPQTATLAPSRYAFIKHLATKQTPTLLYEAPSHFWFYFGCWTSGLSLIGWTMLTGPTVVNQPEGVPKWVGVVYGVSYVLLGCMGFFLISKTPNIVGSIRVLPASPSAAATGPLLEVSVKRMMPLLAPKVVTASLDKVALKSRFSLPDEYVPELKRLEHERKEKARRAAARKVDMTHILTLPFRRVGRGILGMFRGVKSAWTDMGLGHIRIDGNEFKVDVMRGFSHDGFRTLERLVRIGWK